MAFAHAQMRTAVPLVGSTIAMAPSEVAINYTERVDANLCSLTVHDASGARVDKERAAHCLEDRRPMTCEDLRTAIIAGAVERVRPKMMTMVAIMAGLLPILSSEGAGSGVKRRIALSMIGGTRSSTFLTLIVIPAIYVVVKHHIVGAPKRATRQPLTQAAEG